MCETGTASSMWPMRSRRTRASVTSTPQRSQIDALVLDALVLSAGAFPVPCRTENALAEQAALFRLEGAVVDRLRVLDFALGSRSGSVSGRGDGDGDVIEPDWRVLQPEQFTTVNVRFIYD